MLFAICSVIAATGLALSFESGRFLERRVMGVQRLDSVEFGHDNWSRQNAVDVLVLVCMLMTTEYILVPQSMNPFTSFSRDNSSNRFAVLSAWSGILVLGYGGIIAWMRFLNVERKLFHLAKVEYERNRQRIQRDAAMEVSKHVKRAAAAGAAAVARRQHYTKALEELEQQKKQLEQHYAMALEELEQQKQQLEMQINDREMHIQSTTSVSVAETEQAWSERLQSAMDVEAFAIAEKAIYSRWKELEEWGVHIEQLRAHNKEKEEKIREYRKTREDRIKDQFDHFDDFEGERERLVRLAAELEALKMDVEEYKEEAQVMEEERLYALQEKEEALQIRDFELQIREDQAFEKLYQPITLMVSPPIPYDSTDYDSHSSNSASLHFAKENGESYVDEDEDQFKIAIEKEKDVHEYHSKALEEDHHDDIRDDIDSEEHPEDDMEGHEDTSEINVARTPETKERLVDIASSPEGKERTIDGDSTKDEKKEKAEVHAANEDEGNEALEMVDSNPKLIKKNLEVDAIVSLFASEDKEQMAKYERMVHSSISEIDAVPTGAVADILSFIVTTPLMVADDIAHAEEIDANVDKTSTLKEQEIEKEVEEPVVLERKEDSTQKVLIKGKPLLLAKISEENSEDEDDDMEDSLHSRIGKIEDKDTLSDDKQPVQKEEEEEEDEANEISSVVEEECTTDTIDLTPKREKEAVDDLVEIFDLVSDSTRSSNRVLEVEDTDEEPLVENDIILSNSSPNAVSNIENVRNNSSNRSMRSDEDPRTSDKLFTQVFYDTEETGVQDTPNETLESGADSTAHIRKFWGDEADTLSNDAFVVESIVNTLDSVSLKREEHTLLINASATTASLPQIVNKTISSLQVIAEESASEESLRDECIDSYTKDSQRDRSSRNEKPRADLDIQNENEDSFTIDQIDSDTDKMVETMAQPTDELAKETHTSMTSSSSVVSCEEDADPVIISRATGDESSQSSRVDAQQREPLPTASNDDIIAAVSSREPLYVPSSDDDDDEDSQSNDDFLNQSMSSQQSSATEETEFMDARHEAGSLTSFDPEGSINEQNFGLSLSSSSSTSDDSRSSSSSNSSTSTKESADYEDAKDASMRSSFLFMANHENVQNKTSLLMDDDEMGVEVFVHRVESI